MENKILDFTKYKDRLERVYPTYIESELIELFEYKIRYWMIIIEWLDNIYYK